MGFVMADAMVAGFCDNFGLWVGGIVKVKGGDKGSELCQETNRGERGSSGSSMYNVLKSITSPPCHHTICRVHGIVQKRGS